MNLGIALNDINGIGSPARMIILGWFQTLMQIHPLWGVVRCAGVGAQDRDLNSCLDQLTYPLGKTPNEASSQSSLLENIIWLILGIIILEIIVIWF